MITSERRIIMIPKRLKEAREAANFSQEKLAQLVDIESVNSRS
ncbi:TPA: XRE family transcriptional regulator, partial [Escherichia coli]